VPNQPLEFVPGTLEGRTLVISDIVRVFKRYIWLAALLGPGLGLITFLWAKHQPKLYDAVATIQLDQHETLSLPGAIGGSDEYELNTNTQILVIQSRDVAIKVIQKLHLESDRRFNPTYPQNTNLSDPFTRNYLVNLFHASLNVQRVPKTELINVVFRSPSPVLATEVANTTVDTYLAQNFTNHYLGSKEITGWLQGELNGLKDTIQKEQGDLLALEMKLGIYVSGPTSGGSTGGTGGSSSSQGVPSSIFQDEMTTLEAQLLDAEKTRLMAEAEYHVLTTDKTDAFLPETIPGTLLFNTLESQLATLISTEAQTASRYGKNYPPLAAMKKEEDELRKQIADERVKAIASAEQEVKISDESLKRIKTNIEASKEIAKGMNSDTVRYEVLRAQYQTDQGLYNGLLELIGTGGIDAGLKAQNVNRMSAADIPTTPSWPKVFIYTFAGFAVGLTIAILIITVIIIVSDTVETVEQIEETLRLPVLTSVPLYKMEPADPSSSQAVLATLLMPRSAAAESYRILRTAINLMPIRGRGRVIGVTSCGPGEGKSTTVMNLAVAASQQNKRVLLIDGDLRKPALAQRLKLPSATTPGLSRFLSDPQIQPEDCIQPIQSLPGLSVLPVQDIPPFPSELLAQGRLGELLAWARESYDIVLIDTPPVLLVADSLIIAEWLDIVLIVARVRVAQRRALRRVREEFARFPDKHIGIVVNAVPHSQSYYGGYGGYHGYYGSGSSY
jgi:polysaccharide biosynthesis transport protein